MRKLTLFLLMIFISSLTVIAQKTTNQASLIKPVKSILTDYTEFEDNFEAGMTKWTPSSGSAWGLTTNKSHSPTHSLTESPAGNYTNNQTSYCTMTNGVDLTTKMSATVSFWAQFKIEAGFDYMYVDASADNFATFTNLAIFDGVNTTWTQYTYSLGGFVGPGFDNVKVRFRFISDQGYVMDGMYIDDVLIVSSDVDLSPPLVLTTPPEFYEGTLGDFVVEADIIDISGLSVVQCNYTVDGVAQPSVPGVNTSGNQYTFTIPAQSAGSNVDYSIEAIDASTGANSTVTPVASYIAGEYYKYDNGVVDFFVQFAPGEGAAVAFSLNGPTHLATALIRNYTDIDHANGQMLFHVWGSGSAGPGNDLITPFLVTPEASLSNTSPMTRIDLRPYMSQLNNLTGEIFMGFTSPDDTVNITETDGGATGRSLYFDGAAWTAVSADWHFRLITTGSGVGTPELQENEVTVFPNPMSQYSFVRFSKSLQNPRLELYAFDGKKINTRQVLNGNQIQLLRGDLSAGMYLLKLMDGNRLVSQQKLIIN